MMAYGTGRILAGRAGSAVVVLHGDHYRISAAELGRILFGGEQVAFGSVHDDMAGHDASLTAGPGPSGQSIIITAGRHQYFVSRSMVLSIASGEVPSSPIHEWPDESLGIGLIPLPKRSRCP